MNSDGIGVRAGGLVSKDGQELTAMTELFKVCWGKQKGGLLFDEGGHHGPKQRLLKLDANDYCFEKKDFDLPEKEGWEWIGMIVIL